MMFEINMLSILANQFRSSLEKIPRNDFCYRICLANSDFPAACCDEVSQLLAAYFVDHGFNKIQIIHGRKGGIDRLIENHVWLKVNGYNVDITADQFNQQGYILSPVIISNSSDFHKSFKTQTKSRTNPDFREVYKSTPTDLAIYKETYQMILAKMIEINLDSSNHL